MQQPHFPPAGNIPGPNGNYADATHLFMKKLFSILSLALLAVTVCVGAESLTKPADAYAQAVMAYVEAANREMVALHAKLELAEKKAGEEDKAKFADVDRQLDECDRLIERLASATRSTFDRIKSAYEQERGQATKALDALVKNLPATEGS